MSNVINRPVSFETPAGVHRTDCANGLTVLTEYVPGRRSVAVGAWVRYGTLHEPESMTGLAHMLEHMVFKGTAQRTAKQLALALEELGGSLDAWTEREFTSYQARVLDEHLSVAVDVMSDLIFNASLRDSDLELERQVILEEIAMVEDTPDDLVFDLHSELLWGKGPFAKRILGTAETVAAISAADLRALKDARYKPSGMVVAAAGNVSHDEFLALLEKNAWFEESPSLEDLKTVSQVEAVVSNASEHFSRRDMAQVHMVLGSEGPRYGDESRTAFELLSAVVGGGMSSRLFQRVREELGYAYSVYHFHSAYADTGHQGIYLASAPSTAQKAIDAVRELLKEVSVNGISAAELESGRRQLSGQLLLSLESVSARMYRSVSSVLYHEPLRSVESLLEELAEVTSDDIARTASNWFDPDRLSLVSLGPSSVR